MNCERMVHNIFTALGIAVSIATPSANAADPNACDALPNHAALQVALRAAVATPNGGLGNNMWATLVDKYGNVCDIAFSGRDNTAQWLLSRVISAQKANTANGLSLSRGSGGTEIALSTANLYSAVNPGGSLYGLQHSNPVSTDNAYAGNASLFGRPNDPLKGSKVGGVNVFGGGLALYNVQGQRVGGLGVSGDTSCADHNVAWKVRDGLKLDTIPGGVAAGTDNIIHDITYPAGHPEGVSAGGFGHPECSADAKSIAVALPVQYPVGP